MLIALAYWIGLSLSFLFGWCLRGVWRDDPDEMPSDLDPRGYFPMMDLPDRECPTIT